MTRSRGEALAQIGEPAWRLVATGTGARTRWQFRPIVVMRVAIVLMLVGQLGRIPVLSTGTAEAPLLVNDICVIP